MKYNAYTLNTPRIIKSFTKRKMKCFDVLSVNKDNTPITIPKTSVIDTKLNKKEIFRNSFPNRTIT